MQCKLLILNIKQLNLNIIRLKVLKCIIYLMISCNIKLVVIQIIILN